MRFLKPSLLLLAVLAAPVAIGLGAWPAMSGTSTVPATVVPVTQEPIEGAPAKTKLTIVWTSGDPEVAHRMVLMYAHAAKKNGWFEDVQVIIWGPSSRLTAADKDIQAKLAQMQTDGVVVEACIACATTYGIVDRLRELGFEVKPMGKPLSDAIQDPGVHTVTF